MSPTILNRSVLVTGANRGLGQGLVEEALRRGAQRVYAGTRGPLTHPDERVTPVRLDVTDAAQVQEAARRVEALDIVINNAAVAVRDDLSDRATLERHLAVNLLGTYDVTAAFLPALIRSRGVIATSCRARRSLRCQRFRPTRSRTPPRSHCRSRSAPC